MSRINTGREPYQKGSAKPKNRKGLRKVSAKKAVYRASKEGQSDWDYMGKVKQLPCAACGSPAPNDAHHCKDMPPADYNNGMGPYDKPPKSRGARDTIPLCPRWCHNFGPNSYHMGRDNFHRMHGPDYDYIEQTRKLVEGMG